MRQIVTTLGLSAGIAVGSAVAASAAFFDFTDIDIFTTRTDAEAIGNVDDTWFRITANVDRLTYNDTGDAPGPVGPLEGEGDGIGVRDDEVSPNEYVILEFFSDAALTTAKPVRLTGAHFLDLFAAGADDDSPEQVFIYNGAPPPGGGVAAGPILGTQDCCGNPGFKSADGLSIVNSVFSFDSGNAAPRENNDNAGVRDFALAAVETGVIPLPAGVVLLGTALAGLGFARRRKA